MPRRQDPDIGMSRRQGIRILVTISKYSSTVLGFVTHSEARTPIGYRTRIICVGILVMLWARLNLIFILPAIWARFAAEYCKVYSLPREVPVSVVC